MLLSLHPNIIVHVENVVRLFSSPSTSSQKVRKCGSHNFLSQAKLELEQNHYTHPCVPTVYACEFLVAFIWCLCKSTKASKDRKYPGITYVWYIEQVEVLLSQFEWKSRDSPTETRLTDRYRSTDSLSFVTPANFLRAATVRRMANDVTYTMYAALPIHLRVYTIYDVRETCTSLCVFNRVSEW